MRNAETIEQDADEAWHIVSLIVGPLPDKAQKVMEQIRTWDGTEVTELPQSKKFIVTMETNSEAVISEALIAIQHIDGVVSASLVFHQTEASDLDAILPAHDPDTAAAHQSEENSQ